MDKTKDVRVPVRTATPKGAGRGGGRAVSPEGTQQRNKDWSEAEVHIKGGIPVSPEFYIFP